MDSPVRTLSRGMNTNSKQDESVHTLQMKFVDCPHVQLEYLLSATEQTENVKYIRDEILSNDGEAPHVAEITRTNFHRLRPRSEPCARNVIKGITYRINKQVECDHPCKQVPGHFLVARN